MLSHTYYFIINRMINIIGPRGKKNEDGKNATNKNSFKNSCSYLRLQKDLSQIDIPLNAKISFPNKENQSTFEVTTTPEIGSYWHHGTYNFLVTIPNEYPYEPPKIACNTKIYHPNIDLNGNVCLNILRQDWKPVLDINSVIIGLLFLFIEPNPNDPLNEEAAELMRNDKKKFADFIQKTLTGLEHKNIAFPKFI